MLKTKTVSDMWGMKVFTESGEYFGDVDEIVISGNKVYGWKIRSTSASYLSKILGGAKGVVIPHQLVKAIGDIVIVSKVTVPSYSNQTVEESIDGQLE